MTGKVQAILVDPVGYQRAEKERERARLVAALREGEQAIREGRTRPAEEVFADLQAKHGF